MTAHETTSRSTVDRTAAAQYRPLGGFRFALATLVLVSHALDLLPQAEWLRRLSLGNVGVFLFFVLSGFVITEALEEFYPGRIGRSLANRFFKIYSPYWNALAFTVTVYWLTGGLNPEFQTINGVIGNVLMFGQIVRLTTYSAISITWAVIVELQFYLAAALCFFFISRTGRKREVLLGFSAVSLIGYAFVHALGAYNRFYGALQFAPYFVAGIWTYYLRVQHFQKWALPLIAVAVVLSIHAFVSYEARNPQGANIVGPVVLLLFFSCVFAYLLWFGPERGDLHLDKSLGNATYFLYLIHIAVISLVSSIGIRPQLAGFFVACVVSMILAFVLFSLVERSISQIRDAVRGVRLYS
ncbi:MAG TPA: acyltransferase [Candidatus Methylomirabilis sp.]|nr:acyltransferase [Candidatus Methylomirabilis sp.]